MDDRGNNNNRESGCECKEDENQPKDFVTTTSTTTEPSSSASTSTPTLSVLLDDKRDGQKDNLKATPSSSSLPLTLPDSFFAFLSSHSISLDNYSSLPSPLRYFRVNPRNPPLMSDLEKQIGAIPQQVPWLPCFYSIPSSYNLSNVESYKAGMIYGLDVSSGAVVAALNPSLDDHVLDLCCAPGAKLCMLHDWPFYNNDISECNYSGTITGVDLSPARLGVCKTMLKKYKIQNVRLFLKDAATFDILAPNNEKNGSETILNNNDNNNSSDNKNDSNKNGNNKNDNNKSNDDESESMNNNNEKEKGKERVAELSIKEVVTESGKRLHCDAFGNIISKDFQQAMKKIQQKKRRQEKLGRSVDLPDLFFCNSHPIRSKEASVLLYDKVMVDVECTLDASVRHLIEHQKIGWHTFTAPQQIINIQKNLILSGFRLLKVGGFMVYSTCSFSTQQNEDIVQSLLEKEPCAKVVPIQIGGINTLDLTGSSFTPWRQGGLPHTLRFYPLDGTSGMFICKLTKLPFHLT